jgi:MFS family permease
VPGPAIRPLATASLATASLAAVAAFPILVTALNLVQRGDGYDAGHQAVSELALGRDGWLMALAFTALGVGTALLGGLMRRTDRGVVVPALLSIAGALSLVSAVCRTDRAGAPSTLHGQIHDLAGIATFGAMLLAMAICSVRFRREPRWRPFAILSLALTVVGVAGFFLVPVLGDPHFGIAQRILIGSFVAWMLAAAGHGRRITGMPDMQIQPHQRGADVSL